MVIILLLLVVTILLLAGGFSYYRVNRPLAAVLFLFGSLSGLLLIGGFFGLIGG